jgi:PAS domain S-box-containing protein
MQPNTALGLTLGAVALLLLLQSARRTRFRLVAICSLATIVLLLGSATLSEYILRWDLGIDRLFIQEQPTPENPYPGRPSPQTSLNFALLGASLLLRQLSRLPNSRAQIGPLAQIGALIILANVFVALTGYAFGVGALYRFPVIHAAPTGMSVPTALTFASLSLALICSRPSEGVMTLLTSESVSSAIARRIVLILVVGCPLVGILTTLGANAGWYDARLEAPLFLLIMLGLLLWNTWRAAWHGNQIELSREAAEEAARKAREESEVLATRVRNLVEQASDGIFVADLEGRYTNVNDAGCRIVGYAREEIIGKTILDLVRPEDVTRFSQHRERLLGGDGETGEWIIRRKDGTHVPVEVSAKILPDGQWEAIVRDITERKRIERELRYSEAKFSGIVSVSADAKILIDRNQNIVMFNEGAQRIFGHSGTEAMNQSLDILIPERFRLAHHKHIEQFAAGPDKSQTMSARGGVFGLRKNGEEFPADAAISKLTVEGESILTVSLRDITGQKRVENEQRFLSEAGAELSATLDYEDALASIASLAVRGIADVCIIDVPATDGEPGRREAAIRRRQRPARRWRGRLSIRRTSRIGP